MEREFPMTKEQILFSLLRSEIVGETASLDDSVTPELLTEVMTVISVETNSIAL